MKRTVAENLIKRWLGSHNVIKFELVQPAPLPASRILAEFLLKIVGRLGEAPDEDAGLIIAWSPPFRVGFI